MEHPNDCSICLEGLINKEDSCETPCCFKTFHKEKCIGKWVTEHKNCPMCRARIRNKALLFPIKLRTSIELKEDIAISEYRRIREPNRKEVLKNIKERNEDTVYIDEIEDEDAEDDGMPELISPGDPSYYDSPIWNETPNHYIGVNTPSIGQIMSYTGDFDGDEFYPFVMPPPLPNLEPMYYDDGLDSLLVPNVIPNIELATIEDLIITPEINIMEEVD